MKKPSYVYANYRYDFTSKRSIGGYIKEHIIFQIAQIIQLVYSISFSDYFNEIRWDKFTKMCSKERQK